MKIRDFVEWLKYKLHLTDWKRKKLVIYYYTRRDGEAELTIGPAGLIVHPRGELVWLDEIRI